MNHTDLKSYAPQARRDFIQAVTDRAAFYGVSGAKIEPVTVKGDVAIIAGHAFLASVVVKRKKLVDRIERCGFKQTMEALAYTWFNRFVAIRFMELHGYLKHGYRVLSHPDPTKTIPEILELAEHVDLPGLSKEKVIDLKLDVNKESDLYQMLLLAQCHALHSAMPFLFEGIDDETELVLPDNLLHSDSIIRKLVAAGGPEEWLEVEVLGWLYQFYISERKDEVMARKSAVPTEDIPAVTQLFTPHWIVRYLVENSLGRLWLLNRPSSRLREQMPYYIEGEPESDFLKITKPEDIRFLDPACGSGHMLTYAFDLLFLIYEEDGYVPSDIPALILKHNLHGLEICPRAAQLANLALVLKAREKSRRFIQPGNLVQPRIVAMQNLRFEERELRDYIDALDLGALFNEGMLQLLRQFEYATTFGSLIQPCLDETSIVYAQRAIEAKDLGDQLFLRDTHVKVLRALEQAQLLTQQYHVLVANPPYMGSGQMNPVLKDFLAHSSGKGDISAAFMLRSVHFILQNGYFAMITFQNWMFISSFEQLRLDLLVSACLSSLVHCGRGVWGADFGSCAFVFERTTNPNRRGHFRRLFVRPSKVQSNEQLEANYFDLESFPVYATASQQFRRIDGAPIAYWLSEGELRCFNHPALKGFAVSGGRCKTHDDETFVRFLWEIDSKNISSNGPWKLLAHGGDFRKWYGNKERVFAWTEKARSEYASHGGLSNSKYWNKSGICWSDVTIAQNSFRIKSEDSEYSSLSPTLIPIDPEQATTILGFLNTSLANNLLRAINPTLHANVGDVQRLPFVSPAGVSGFVQSAIEYARADWDNFETSRNFRDQPLLRRELKAATLEASWRNWEAQCTAAINRMKELETENNRLFIAAYGLNGRLQPEVAEDQITLARSDARRDVAALLSYGVGCTMGRYSLDHPGLILANAGGSRREFLEIVGLPHDGLTFSLNEDGIMPVLDGEWFNNDIVARTHDFLRTTFGPATLEANLRFIEESLGKDLRKYVLIDFYKDHLQTYKKRPIYWLFSSGKERAFQALVYLHRYHEGTLSRMRTEYVIPLQGKIASRSDQLADDIQKATSTSHRKKMEKERDKLVRQQTELQAFDEKLRHYADQRIQLDLDDGVKVNYGKFGDLLAEAESITGGGDE